MYIGDTPDYEEWEDEKTGERLFILKGVVITQVSLASDVPDQHYIMGRIPGKLPWEETIGKRFLKKVEKQNG